MATAASTPESAPAATGLPELAAVYWRPRVDPRRLRRSARLWTLTTVAHTVPFLAAATLLVALKPVTAPVALILVAHAWAIPELYAARGAGVVRIPPGSTLAREPATAGAQARALGLLAASDSGLPVGDRIAHLLLALREDETGLATVANLAFSGAVWRLRRRLAPVRRPALARAVQASRRT